MSTIQLAEPWAGPLPGEFISAESKAELEAIQAHRQGILAKIRMCIDFANDKPRPGETRAARQLHAAQKLNKLSGMLKR